MGHKLILISSLSPAFTLVQCDTHSSQDYSILGTKLNVVCRSGAEKDD